MRLLRFFSLLALPLATACVEPSSSPQHIDAKPTAAFVDATGMPTVRARYAAYPEVLMTAVGRACSDPAEKLIRRSRNWLDCQSYLPPDATAALILQYDGVIEDLPTLLISFRLYPKSGGAYELHQQAYAVVPQRGGGKIRIAQPSAATDAKMRKLILKSGGVPF